ncbi:MAG TPA: hypothetical protein DEF51_43610, partial [Myxococcales bacterium]|nr:hypothetical protein [Myxococcales bacterium]
MSAGVLVWSWRRVWIAQPSSTTSVAISSSRRPRSTPRQTTAPSSSKVPCWKPAMTTSSWPLPPRQRRSAFGLSCGSTCCSRASREVGVRSRSCVLMGLTAVGLTGASCAGIRTDPPRQAADADTDFAHTLQLAPSELATLDPELRTTLRDNPHHYLRYVANRFVGVSCEVANEGATVNLHGDPHLEQYVVTSLGRGLSDFDEATIGPVGIDLIRLATSIRIASRMRGWDSELLWARFVEGYLHALADPALSVPEPDYAS